MNILNNVIQNHYEATLPVRDIGYVLEFETIGKEISGKNNELCSLYRVTSMVTRNFKLGRLLSEFTQGEGLKRVQILHQEVKDLESWINALTIDLLYTSVEGIEEKIRANRVSGVLC